MSKAYRTKTQKIPGIYEPIEYTVEYRICDQCGSSDISIQGIHLSLSINAVFSIVIMLFFYGAIVVGFITSNIKFCLGIGMISMLFLLIYLGLYKYVEGNNYWKCNKCGNENIT
jgi:hypothetical protein